MRRFFRWALIKRFLLSLRDDGVRVSLRKARNYISLQRQDGLASVLSEPDEPVNGYLHGVWADMARGGGFHVARRLSEGRRIALIGDLNLPQCRKYRVEQMAEFWASQGVPCDFAHYEDVPRAAQLLQNATHLCEYRLKVCPETTTLRYEARRMGLPVLYDIDDPLFSVSAYGTYQNMKMLDPWLETHFMSEAPKYAGLMNAADMISVSTPGLVEHAGLYTRRPVVLRRNFADRDTLETGAAIMAARPDPDALFRVVFASGSQGHEADFELIADEVEAFVMADPRRRLIVLGHFRADALPSGLKKQTEVVKFTTYDAYLSHVAQADVALMPLQDDLFNRCKSAVRVIDAASVGVVSIVSDVGDLPNLVKDGETGIVARSPEDWSRALNMLAANPDQTSTMKQAARQWLETHWAGQAEPHVIAPELLEWVRG
ncbi:MAG: glycosyltransferase [Pseudomonadota bacterium]